MAGSRYCSGNRARRSSLVAVVVVALFAGRAYAQAGGDAVAAQTGEGLPRVTVQFLEVTAAGMIPPDPPAPQRLLIRGKPLSAPALVLNGTQARVVPVSPGRRHRSITRKVVGGVIGTFGGFLGGGFLGAKIERPCHCDDPGLRGFIIGAPIGAVIGGILGAKLF